ncbi:MAG TPA: RNA polymerase sigma factor [Vicinamibacterales bacterium]|nr:RNA polymerase sigma factor [Vicinamibacterales bacterium]
MPEPSPSTPSDLELVNRFRRFNDHPAFDRLVERHQGWVRGLCARMLRSDELAKDAAQEVFTRALAHLGHWRGDNFPGWLKAIAVNCALTIIEREKRWAPLEPAPDLPSPARDPEQLLLSEETAVRARAVIARLPEKQRIVFVMKHIDGCSYDDIARLTGFTAKEVKSFLQNARRNFSHWWTAE